MKKDQRNFIKEKVEFSKKIKAFFFSNLGFGNSNIKILYYWDILMTCLDPGIIQIYFLGYKCNLQKKKS